MKHGDISSHSAPIIGFNVDNLLYLPKANSGNLYQRIKSVFIGEQLEIDHRFAKLLIDVWNAKSTYAIYLYSRKTEQDFRDLEGSLYERDYRFSHLQTFPPLEEMRFTVANLLAYYFDSDNEYLACLGTPKALHISEVGERLGLGYSFPKGGQQ